MCHPVSCLPTSDLSTGLPASVPAGHFALARLLGLHLCLSSEKFWTLNKIQVSNGPTTEVPTTPTQSSGTETSTTPTSTKSTETCLWPCYVAYSRQYYYPLQTYAYYRQPVVACTLPTCSVNFKICDKFSSSRPPYHRRKTSRSQQRRRRLPCKRNRLTKNQIMKRQLWLRRSCSPCVSSTALLRT